MSLASVLVDHFTEEAGHSRSILAAAPQDMFAWKPHEKSMTLAQLTGHIAEMPAWCNGILEGDLDFLANGDYKPYLPETKADLLETFDRNVAGFQQALDGRDDELMLTTWTMRAGEKVLMSKARHAALRQVAVHHVIHHRGQLSVYLRLLAVPVPGTYGPTADTPALF
jgi:uncharacterized damage-inducible protein DinB